MPRTQERHALGPAHRRVSAGIVLVSMAASVLWAGMPLTFPWILADFVSGPTAFGVQHFLWAVTVVLFLMVGTLMLAGASLLQRFGPRRLLLGGGGLFVLGLVAFAVAQSLVIFLAGAVLMGLGLGASLQLVPTALVTAWFLERRAFVLNLAAWGTAAGGIVWAIAVPRLVEAYRVVWGSGSWRIVYVAFAVGVVILVGPSAGWLVRDEPSQLGTVALGADVMAVPDAWRPRPEVGLTLHRALGEPWFYVIFVSTWVLGVVDAFVLLLPLHTAGRLGLRDAYGAWWVTVLVGTLALSVALGRQLLTWLGRRLGAFWPAAATLTLQGIGMVYLATLKTDIPLPLAALTAAFVGFGWAGAGLLPAEVLASTLGRRDLGRIWSLAGTAHTIGIALGVAVWGHLQGLLGGFTDLTYGGAVALVPIALAWWLAIHFGGRRYAETVD